MKRPAWSLICVALAASAVVHARTLRDASGQPLGGGAREDSQRAAPEQTAQPRSAPERAMPLRSGPLPHPPSAPPIAAPPGPPPQTLPVPRFGVERGRDRSPQPGVAQPSDPSRGRWNTLQPGRVAGERNGERDDRSAERNWVAPADPRRNDRAWQRNERPVPRVAEPARRVYQWRDYDRFRVQHFRFQDGRYVGRTRYQVGPYLWPRGFGIRLWGVGEWLPTPFYLDNQYLIDYWRFGLYEPPLGCRWVRVGNDALLVDDFNGEVLDAIYDLFW